ncbi:type VII secretion protein EccCa [Frankia sp. CiP3]|uniref:type VII secretion protein EccCa n=1 Tax=Frankia sp. CiP3 TaxID=2880971 RepID=UPI0035B25EF5
MSTVIFRRPPRRAAPEVPAGELPLQEPPALPETESGGMYAILMYLPMALGSGATVLIFIQPGAAVIMYLASGAMALSMVGMLLAQLLMPGGNRKRKLHGERRDYLRYLSQVRRQVRRVMDAQRRNAQWLHPDPARLWSVAMSGRLWERRLTHPDFAEVRLATGEQRLAVRFRPPQTKPIEDLEPLCARALRRFIRAHATVQGLPMAVHLRAFARIMIKGDIATSRGMLRAMLAQAATFHAPGELVIAVCAASDRQQEWEWIKWLPHAQHPREHDATGPVRIFADDYADLEQLLGDDFIGRPRFEPDSTPSRDEPYVIVILDGVPVPHAARLAEAGFRNAVAIAISGDGDGDGALRWRADRLGLRLATAPDRVDTIGVDSASQDVATRLGRPDTLDVTRCRALARLLAAQRVEISVESTEAMSTDINLTTLLGTGDPNTFDPPTAWASRSPWDRLRVPIGVAEDGSPVELDLKESAQGGMGPHGILIGATGSGKSELLRTLVLALAMTHSPEVLNVVLVDFKGGATFLGLDALPHTSAIITNLADELPLVDRMQDALHGELVRRQEALRRAGHSSLHEYERARIAGAPIEPMPTLIIIVDEFSELLASKRDFTELFVMIGRLGRSLGVHLLLASQRLDEGRVHVLESHLSYRIALRTFSAMESRAVLGLPDAYTLPSAPGNGYLKTDTSTLIRFRAAYVSAPHRATTVSARRAAASRQVAAFAASYMAPALPPSVDQADQQPEVSDADPPGKPLIQIILDRLRGEGPPAHQIWLPPLSDPPTLDQLLPPLAPDPEHGLVPLSRPDRSELSVPVGIVDRPFDGLRDLLMVDLAGGAGHVGVVGAPQSGKSTLLRTLILSLALTHTPRQVQFYCLDFGGGTLGGLADLPHVGGVASRLDVDRVARIVAEVSGLLTARERLFADHGLASMADYRQLRRDGGYQEDPYGDVFIVIDGWFTLRQEFEQLEPVLSDLANRGLNYGVHLIISAARWSEIRPGMRDLIGSRLELHLGDALDSEVGSRAAANVPAVPGRGLTSEALHFLSALPRLDSSTTINDLAVGTRAVVDAVLQAWPGPSAPAVRLLPSLLAAERLPPPDGDLRMAIGLDEHRLEPVFHDFGESAHLIVIGDAGAGKTNLLRLVAQAVEKRYSTVEARIMLADYRRDLFSMVTPERQLGYAVSSDALRQIVREASETLRARLPGPEITPDRLRRRDWWMGPRLFVVVDDYDLVSSGMTSPLEPLLDLLPQGADIGLHLIVARAAAGASRAMLDPIMRRLWDLGTPALLMSCPRDEGMFLGDVRPRTLPPGRAQLVSRRQAQLVQCGFVPVPAVEELLT